jgi:hypothetical protein
MKLLSWLARKTKHVAISLGWPGRPIGVPENWSIAEFIVLTISGVQTSRMVRIFPLAMWNVVGTDLGLGRRR